ncbi:hypothetical protein CDEST_13512 [Colletotrichum destructivum]|uniref:Uncharacterized protein n=1 Tax=Colletotrichum destructivum TaxID=34406 RepID=A0AAX4IYX9_9PEZI|nr:hypothetical protein CDEST_13512 [Colletotrichum destructivum]
MSQPESIQRFLLEGSAPAARSCFVSQAPRRKFGRIRSKPARRCPVLGPTNGQQETLAHGMREMKDILCYGTVSVKLSFSVARDQRKKKQFVSCLVSPTKLPNPPSLFLFSPRQPDPANKP